MKIDSGRILNDFILPNKKQYCIPVFQRDYAWTAEQCQKLFDDIVLAYKLDRLHFCGSFVYAPLHNLVAILKVDKNDRIIHSRLVS